MANLNSTGISAVYSAFSARGFLCCFLQMVLCFHIFLVSHASLQNSLSNTNSEEVMKENEQITRKVVQKMLLSCCSIEHRAQKFVHTLFSHHLLSLHSEMALLQQVTLHSVTNTVFVI